LELYERNLSSKQIDFYVTGQASFIPGTRLSLFKREKV
jgi:hypothetical protein